MIVTRLFGKRIWNKNKQNVTYYYCCCFTLVFILVVNFQSEIDAYGIYLDGPARHNIRITYLSLCGGAVVSWLVRSTPERALRVRALAWDIALCP